MKNFLSLLSSASLLTTALCTPALIPTTTENHGRNAAPGLVTKSLPTSYHLLWGNAEPGKEIKGSKKLRILTVGDSITVGFPNDGDGNGYRETLRNDLSKNEVVYAGTESNDKSTMKGNYYAAWSGKTIQYISDHVDESLDQRPNIIILAAGTNDMNSSPTIATEGNNPSEASKRLGELVDKMVAKCPDATILVSMIIPTCGNEALAVQQGRTEKFQQLVADVVKTRYDDGKHVLAADFVGFWKNLLRSDCVHPTEDGYHEMGHDWYDFITQIPQDWINEPVGPDPAR